MEIKSIYDFLLKLKKHNKKSWFDEHKKEYQTARKLWIDFVQETLDHLVLLDQEFIHLDPRKCIYRINRDIRFSKNKQPYKTNFGAFFVPGGKSTGNAGYYLHLEPGNSFIAAGIYMPESEKIKAIRSVLDKKYPDFEKIINAPSLKKHFGVLEPIKLTNPPRGYDKNHPGIDYLKFKSFIVVKNIPDEFYDQKNVHKKIHAYFQSTQGLVDFCNKAIKSNHEI